MDNFNLNNSVMNINNALIENINFDNATTFITVTYRNPPTPRGMRQTVVLTADRRTIVLDENGNNIPVRRLHPGMTVNTTVSQAMTRSIPPQTNAHVIKIVRQPGSDNITMGRIVDIDRANRSFVTITDTNLSSIIRFNVPDNAIILNRAGRPINFSRLVPGLKVWIRHASFMTASIPPQTTAFEIRIQ